MPSTASRTRVRPYAYDTQPVKPLAVRRCTTTSTPRAYPASELSSGAFGTASTTTPFSPEDMSELRGNAPQVVQRCVPDYEQEYARRGWTMFDRLDRVYVNDKARVELGWRPRHDFRSLIARLKANEDICSPLAQAIGSKGYHERAFEHGPYPVDDMART